MVSTLQHFFDQVHATLGDKTVGASCDITVPCTFLLTIRISVIVTLAVIFFVFTFIVFLAVVATCFRGLFKTDSEDAEIGRRITAQANAHLCYMSGIPCGRGCPCERRRKLTMLSETKRRDWDTSDSSLCSYSPSNILLRFCVNPVISVIVAAYDPSHPSRFTT